MTTDTPPPLAADDLLAHAHHLRRLIRILVRDDQAADDVLQRTYMTAIESPPATRGNLRGWLSRVAVNFAKQRRRSDQRRSFRERRVARAETESTPGPDEVATRMDLVRRVTERLGSLEEPYRTTLYLRYFEDLSAAEIARRSDVPAATVRTRLKRGLDQIRATLDDDHGGDRARWTAALLPLALADEMLAAAAAAPPGARSGSALPWLVATPLLIVPLLWSVDDAGAPPPPQRSSPQSPAAPEPPPRADELPESPVEPPDAPVASDAPTDAPAIAAASAPQDEQPRPPLASPHPEDGETSTAHRRAERSGAPAPLPPYSVRLPPGMVALTGTAAQPIGIDEKPLRKAIDELGSSLPRKSEWEAAWTRVFLLSTPAHRRDVPPVWMGRYEVTNAQWKTFFDAPINAAPPVTTGGRLRTLGEVAAAVYGAAEGRRYQRAWRALLAWNPWLLEHLPGGDAADFDPVAKRADRETLPSGIELRVQRLLPPPDWHGIDVPADEANRPVRGIDWEDAAAFCRWAGVHLPTEVEWERAARGDQGRRFPWGDEWSPGRAVWRGHDEWAKTSGAAPVGKDGHPDRPVPVDSVAFSPGATPERVFHLAGNVSEWVFDRARRYPGSNAYFPLDGIAHVARGANFLDSAEFLLASDRAAEATVGQGLGSAGVGFRIAAYPQPGRDLTMPIADAYGRPNARKGPPLWFPIPPGLSERDRTDRSRRSAFQGLALEGTAGLILRHVAEERSPEHVHITGRAKGVALLPVKGLPPGIRHERDLERLTADGDQTVLLGVLCATPGRTLDLVGPSGEGAVRVVFEGRRIEHGLFLVMRGSEITVHDPDPGNVGVPDKHLAGAPLGVLPRPFEAALQRAAVAPSAEKTRAGATLTVGLPILDRGGAIPRQGRHLRVTIQVPIDL